MRHWGNNKKEKNPDESEEKNVSGSISVSFPTIPFTLFSLWGRDEVGMTKNRDII